MIAQKEFFELAQLAEASYANLVNIVNRSQLVEQLKNYEFNKMAFSDTQRAFKILCHLKSANALRLLAAGPDRRTCSFGAEPTTRISSSMLS